MRIASDTAVMVSRFYNKVITLAEKVKHNEGNAQNKKKSIMANPSRIPV